MQICNHFIYSSTCFMLFVFINIQQCRAQLIIADSDAVIEGTSNKESHLKACCFEYPRHLNMKRNSTGHIVSLSGISPEMLNWLSAAFNFTFECVTLAPSMPPSMENTSNSIGFFHMLAFGMCDAIVGPLVLSYNRNKYFQLNVYMESTTNMLIEKPKVSFSNLEAIWKPFQPKVWLVLLFLLPVITLVLALMDTYSVNDGSNRSISYLIKTYSLFVFQTVTLRGGNPLFHNKLKMRIAMAAWCLLSFVLVTCYSSVLISFIMAPHYHPLISTVKELVEIENISPVVVRGFAVDKLIPISLDPMMKKLSKKIDSNPKNRCKNSVECLDRVKQGSNVYIDSRSQLILAMEKDHANTGECNVAFARDKFPFVFHLNWGIRFNDPRKESFNLGMLRMVESGLIDWWDRRTAGSERCIVEQKQLPPSSSRLTFSNLLGPFVILLFGFCLSLLVWIGEIFISWVGSILALLVWVGEKRFFLG